MHASSLARLRSASISTCSFQHPFPISTAKCATFFRKLTLESAKHVSDRQGLTGALSDENCSQHCKLDLSTSCINTFREKFQVFAHRSDSFTSDKSLNYPEPDFQPLLHIGFFEINNEPQASDEGWINIVFLIGCQNRYARKRFDRLQQIGRVRIRKLVLCIADFTNALAEHGIGLVKQQNCIHISSA